MGVGKSCIDGPMGVGKSRINSPMGLIFARLGLLEERIDVGCQFHELPVNVDSERIHIRPEGSYIGLCCRGGVYGGRLRHWILRVRGPPLPSIRATETS